MECFSISRSMSFSSSEKNFHLLLLCHHLHSFSLKLKKIPEKINTWFSIIVQAHNKGKETCRVQQWNWNFFSKNGVFIFSGLLFLFFLWGNIPASLAYHFARIRQISFYVILKQVFFSTWVGAIIPNHRVICNEAYFCTWAWNSLHRKTP